MVIETKTLCCELYNTPEGFDPLILGGDGVFLNEVNFLRDPTLLCSRIAKPGTYPFFESTRAWLNCYFAKETLPAFPKMDPAGISDFGKEVLALLMQIPLGELTTYGAIAQQIAALREGRKMSAQAVGGAVGRNPLCILIPCHRVIGNNGSLTGFGGGMNNKIALLQHEGIDLSKYTIPTRGTKL